MSPKKKKKRFFPIKIIVKIFVLSGIGLILALFFSMGNIRVFIPHVFSILGGEKHYLIVFQNSNELRPGGGFITAYADITVKNGFFKKINIKDSYALSGHEYIKPPYPMGKLLDDPWYEGYTFRDANFSPHFPENAESLIDFYKIFDKNIKFDGVASVNFSVIESLLEKLGPIKINGKTYDAKTLFQDIEFQVKNIDRHNEKSLKERKNIFKKLGKKLIYKSVFHPFKLLSVASKSLAAKDIQLFFKDDAIQKDVSYYNFGGEFSPKENHDFIGIVIANLGGKKSDRYMKKEIEYIVNLREDDSPEGELKIYLKHFGEINQYSGIFKGYLRVFLNNDVTIKKTPEGSKISKEKFTVSGNEIIIIPGEEKTFVYKFSLSPFSYLKNQYHLHLHKQSGTNDFYRIVVKSPTGTTIRSEDFDARENRAYFESKLNTDKNLSLEVLPDISPPLIIDQRFEDMEKISVSFNEALNPLSASDLQNYVFFDKNITDEKKDKIKIKKVEIKDKTVFLKVSGITKQPMERYLLRLSNIQDRYGNVIVPNPKEITVVQRFNKKH